MTSNTILVGDLRERASAVHDALAKRGWDDGDQIDARQAFDEFCLWHGLVGWGGTLRSVLESLGWTLSNEVQRHGQ